jgi:hypothetical protein
MKPIRALALGTILATTLSQAQAYDVVKRYKLIDDKLKTEAMLRPIGHDFFIDLSVAMNKNLQDVISDVNDVNKSQASDAAKIAEANRVLTKYDKTEQTVKVNVSLGVPLPSFTAWDTKIQPNLRVLADVGANIGIRNQKLNNQDLLNLFSEDLPVELKTFLLGVDLATYSGQDIRTVCLSQFPSTSSPANVYCTSLPVGKYVIPTIGTTDPTMTLLAKADVKVGFFNNYVSGEHWFGNFNLYAMGRADLYQFLTGTQIAKGDSIESPKKMNTETTIQTDYRLGYKNSNYSVFGSVEELKLSKLKDADAGAKEHTYGYDALLRLHADADYRFSVITFQPFVGMHKRSGYGLADGLYAGTTLGAYVWGDRLGLQLRAMFDKEYITISPRVKLWLMQLEYSLKKPLKDSVDDVKLTAIHSLDFRIFF